MKIFVFAFMLFGCFAFAQSDTISTNVVKEDASQQIQAPDQEPTFPGGLNEFRNLLRKHFKPENIKKKGKLSAVITFVINADGTLSDLKYEGDPEVGREGLNALKKFKKKWNPGYLNGVPVRSYYKMPLTMVFD